MTTDNEHPYEKEPLVLGGMTLTDTQGDVDIRTGGGGMVRLQRADLPAIITWLTADSDESAPDDLLYEAWAIIANVSEGDWTQQSDEWLTAATRWRDRWHAHLDSQAPS
jgi:hypothetical protein